jgi:hypothetical protein
MRSPERLDEPFDVCGQRLSLDRHRRQLRHHAIRPLKRRLPARLGCPVERPRATESARAEDTRAFMRVVPDKDVSAVKDNP